MRCSRVAPLLWFALASAAPAQVGPSAANYPSLQAAIDRNPGQQIFVPAGDWPLTAAVVLQTDGCGLFGPGRLVQSDPTKPIIAVRRAKYVVVRDLTLTRAEGAKDAKEPALDVQQAELSTFERLTVVENHSQAGAISLRGCQEVAVRDCLVQNYATIGVDDRTGSPDWGYAFAAIDGTGILLKECVGAVVQGNRVIEARLRPTPEVKAEHHLGEFVRKVAVKGALVSQETWDAGYTNNWHQGSAILVSSPETTRGVQILDNRIVNAAQGIDIHADEVIVSGNLVDNAFIGMKAMHGSRHVLIANNQFRRNVLWAIGLMPGAASRQGNTDGDSIIAHNIISAFGYGDAWWNWSDRDYTRAPILLEKGQKPENPPLRNVVITGNVVSDTARDGAPDDTPPLPPRYKYAVLVVQGGNSPEGIRLEGNSFQPGTLGITNFEAKP